MDAEEQLTVLSVGHSTYDLERFLGLLQGAQVTALADVRTAPFSRHFNHFNKDALQAELKAIGISYVFLGKELGGRPKNKDFYSHGVADYEKMAEGPEFASGLERLIQGARKYRIAIMCSEGNPLDCHRCLLVGRALAKRRIVVRHILSDGNILDHSQIEERLLAMAGQDNNDFFASREERLNNAYRERSRKVAFSEPELSTEAG